MLKQSFATHESFPGYYFPAFFKSHHQILYYQITEPKLVSGKLAYVLCKTVSLIEHLSSTNDLRILPVNSSTSLSYKHNHLFVAVSG
jgi:hypothetical protein